MSHGGTAGRPAEVSRRWPEHTHRAHFTQLRDGTVTASFAKNTGTCTPPED